MSIKPTIAILTSKNGTTAEAFIHATQDGRVDADVGLVVCNNPPENAGVYGKIAALNALYGLNIEIVEISGRTHPDGDVGHGQTLAESAAICNKIAEGGYTHVALMGYMRILRGELIERYGWQPNYTSIYQARMTNTHPGPLPETANTYGIHTSKRVLELGMKASRHTVHLVAEEVDSGPVLAEYEVGVLPGDTPEALFGRVQAAEKIQLPLAINDFLKKQAEYLASQ